MAETDKKKKNKYALGGSGPKTETPEQFAARAEADRKAAGGGSILKRGDSQFIIPERELKKSPKLQTELLQQGQQAQLEQQILTEETQREGFQEQTGSQGLRESLEEKIANRPDLDPNSASAEAGLAGKAAQVGLTPAVAAGVGILKAVEGLANLKPGANVDLTKDKSIAEQAKEMADTKAGKALGLVTGAVATALAVALAAPAASVIAAKTTIFSSVTGTVTALSTSSGILKLGLGAAAVGFGAKELTDIERGEIETHKKIMQKMVEDGERLEADARNGFPTTDTIELLTIMSDEIDNAENVIKQKGINNIKFRASDEYLEVMALARSARKALLRRVNAVENIAVTGTAALDPAALIYSSNQY